MFIYILETCLIILVWTSVSCFAGIYIGLWIYKPYKDAYNANRYKAMFYKHYNIKGLKYKRNKKFR